VEPLPHFECIDMEPLPLLECNDLDLLPLLLRYNLEHCLFLGAVKHEQLSPFKAELELKLILTLIFMFREPKSLICGFLLFLDWVPLSSDDVRGVPLFFLIH
jgi:hypothetical protein